MLTGCGGSSQTPPEPAAPASSTNPAEDPTGDPTDDPTAATETGPFVGEEFCAGVTPQQLSEITGRDIGVGGGSEGTAERTSCNSVTDPDEALKVDWRTFASPLTLEDLDTGNSVGGYDVSRVDLAAGVRGRLEVGETAGIPQARVTMVAGGRHVEVEAALFEALADPTDLTRDDLVRIATDVANIYAPILEG